MCRINNMLVNRVKHGINTIRPNSEKTHVMYSFFKLSLSETDK